jgi:phage host-nuclease inhibitor protein Gam
MSALEQNLQDYLLGEPIQEGFVIDTMEKAEWAMRKLAKITRDNKNDEEMAQVELDRINGWLTERQLSRKREVEFFEGLLTKYHSDLLLIDGKLKTVKLPHGTLKARKLPDKWEYNDSAILAWAKGKDRQEMIRVKEEVVKDAVKKAVKEDGESIPGVTIVPQGISYGVEVLV